MQKKYGFIIALLASAHVCAEFAPIPGENQWRMISRIGECVDMTFSKVCVIEEDLLSIGDVLCSKIEKVDDDVLSVGDTLCSKIEQVNDNLLSIGDVVCSKLEKIESDVIDVDNDLLSIGDVLCSKIENVDDDLLSVGDTLCSKLENLEQDIIDVDGDVLSVGDTLCSKLENLELDIFDVDNDLLSIGDTLCSKIDMLKNGGGDCLSDSFLEIIADKLCDVASNVDTIMDGGLADVATQFGELVTVGRDEHLFAKFQYGVPSLDVATNTVDSGFIVEMDSFAIASTGTDATGAASLYSRRYLRYQPSHDGYAFFSAIFFDGGVADSTQWIGLFDDEDGFAIGYNGTTFSLLYRNDGVDTIIPQASFDDPLDGTGDSGIVLDPTKLNEFKIRYGWLGASTITFDILTSDGLLEFHRIETNNTMIVPSLKNPFLPMRVAVTNDGNTSDVRLGTSGWNAGVLGQFKSPYGSRLFSTHNIVNLGAGSEDHIVTIRNKSTFASMTNKIDIRVAAIGGGSFDTQNKSVLLRLRRNATVMGTAFSDINTTNSVIEVSTAGSYTAATGDLILILPRNNASNGPELTFFAADNSLEITLQPGESFTITGESASGAANDVLGVITWDERV